MQRLRTLGIGTGVHYRPVHAHPYYRERLGFRADDLPVATRLGEETLSIPLSSQLEDADVKAVIRAVREACPQ